mmetsp:Transcript_15194/g.24676  ORF Transcript_15194/g.24676 Transcript_15194/m.24676 type:complete len:107 (+) Transcript_15194:187-507(+)
MGAHLLGRRNSRNQIIYSRQVSTMMLVQSWLRDVGSKPVRARHAAKSLGSRNDFWRLNARQVSCPSLSRASSGHVAIWASTRVMCKSVLRVEFTLRDLLLESSIKV